MLLFVTVLILASLALFVGGNRRTGGLTAMLAVLLTFLSAMRP